MFEYGSVSLSVCLSVYLSVCLSVCLADWLAGWLSSSLSGCLAAIYVHCMFLATGATSLEFVIMKFLQPLPARFSTMHMPWVSELSMFARTADVHVICCKSSDGLMTAARANMRHLKIKLRHKSKECDLIL